MQRAYNSLEILFSTRGLATTSVPTVSPFVNITPHGTEISWNAASESADAKEAALEKLAARVKENTQTSEKYNRDEY